METYTIPLHYYDVRSVGRYCDAVIRRCRHMAVVQHFIILGVPKLPTSISTFQGNCE
jgi:hypothetical protein